jgi:hypothetical protein
MSAFSQGQLAPPQSLFSCRVPLWWDRAGTGQLLSGPTGPPFPIDAVVESVQATKGRKTRGSGDIRESTSVHMDPKSAALAGGVHPALNQMPLAPGCLVADSGGWRPRLWGSWRGVRGFGHSHITAVPIRCARERGAWPWPMSRADSSMPGRVRSDEPQCRPWTPAAIPVSLSPGSKDGPRVPHQIPDAEMGWGILESSCGTSERVSQLASGLYPLEQSHPSSVC